jgi:hypothetical protein
MVRTCAVCIVCLLTVRGAFSQENNSFVERQVYSASTFRFDVPRPWYYASPDIMEAQNVARCYLNSRLRIMAEGVFVVDAGRATKSTAETIDGMTGVMKHGKNDVEVSREDVVLDGDKAVHLKSSVADYYVPCKGGEEGSKRAEGQ